MKKTYFFLTTVVLCMALLIATTSMVSKTSSRYASRVTETASFDMEVNPHVAAEPSVSVKIVKLHSNTDSSFKTDSSDVIGEISVWVDDNKEIIPDYIPNVDVPVNTGYIFKGYYGKPAGSGTYHQFYNENGIAVDDFICDDLYAEWIEVH